MFTFDFTLQFGGRAAFVDDLYIRQDFGDRGLGTAPLRALRVEAKAMRVRVIHLLVARTNHRAEALYRREGFGVLRCRFMVTPVAGSG